MILLPTCTLRSFRFGDEDSLQFHANNPAVWNNLRDSFPHPYLKNDAVDWISAHHQQLKPLNLAITVEDQVIGGIGLIPQTDIYKLNAEIGYWLGEAFWGKGIMTDALKGMLVYAFGNFNFIRIYAGVFETNPASMRVLEKAGFQKEAIHRKAILKNGRILDEHVYSIFKESQTNHPV
jgi:[ribosomal protein S5]-alanine N-acetyltransferase